MFLELRYEFRLVIESNFFHHRGTMGCYFKVVITIYIPLENTQVVRGIKRLMRNAVEFVDGMVENFDAIILATGHRSNVPRWLKVLLIFIQEFTYLCPSR